MVSRERLYHPLGIYAKDQGSNGLVSVYKKDLHDPDNHNDVITHLGPDILDCEVKWALESITMNKASGGDGMPLSYFKS